MKTRLAVVSAQLADLADLAVTPAVADLLCSDDIEAAWTERDLERQRAVIATLMDVLLALPGRGTFDPNSVQIAWRNPGEMRRESRAASRLSETNERLPQGSPRPKEPAARRDEDEAQWEGSTHGTCSSSTTRSGSGSTTTVSTSSSRPFAGGSG